MISYVGGGFPERLISCQGFKTLTGEGISCGKFTNRIIS